MNEQKGSLPCVELLLNASGHVDKSCFGSLPKKAKCSACLDFLVNQVRGRVLVVGGIV
jgi:hypothetical protein